MAGIPIYQITTLPGGVWDQDNEVWVFEGPTHLRISNTAGNFQGLPEETHDSRCILLDLAQGGPNANQDLPPLPQSPINDHEDEVPAPAPDPEEPVAMDQVEEEEPEEDPIEDPDESEEDPEEDPDEIAENPAIEEPMELEDHGVWVDAFDPDMDWAADEIVPLEEDSEPESCVTNEDFEDDDF